MISASASPPIVLRSQLAAVSLVGSGLVTVAVFLSGFVIDEPAPYELFMACLIGLWALFGLKISRYVAPLLSLLVLFMVGGMLSLTVMADLATGPMYMAVSGFLALSAVFFAAIIEDRHQRLRLIFNAWVAAAIITALLGILGYFGAMPGGANFTLYDRAKGAFQDPNVFGPFLAAPALYLIHGLLTQPIRRAPPKIVGLLILALGVFLSFSRAAWALNLFCVVAFVFVMLLKERSGLFRLRILVLALCGALFIVAALAAALQSEQVATLFSSRSQLVQEYDGGHLGRFDRHRIGFLMAMEKPLGIGPLVFSTIFPEDEHNIWLKCLTSYGWIGLIAYVTLIAWTLSLGFRFLLLDRPWQPYLMIAWVTLIGHAGVGNVIDTDHWRHFYMLLGIVWGCAALEYRFQRCAPAGRHI
ncbi:O-antigen ligase family protein [Sinorhizobium mexicanum]|uniref:O-antigen ligase family protein n=1 Tax=Sinorhizobium mexicanum TaxID=375549 RepID=A0A859QFZ7_9HYPH|nr:O-antigen ligase family protein [Sinorhizobium mexicanum]MBP1882697.1 O-antigen ligase [Sinorhizobium mexicanum]QLL61145.1 O-antigen ligase family protein [Sinorhizobium mexicanum]